MDELAQQLVELGRLLAVHQWPGTLDRPRVRGPAADKGRHREDVWRVARHQRRAVADFADLSAGERCGPFRSWNSAR
ncbi:hypothetical protein MUY14_12835 [Amycolatopsis sp. FBCC-B4732]|uniref:hypothetical protein n=1 Tax=Amycolatopsis sp. FBCC-B4732 TaxID=3079339 RepID=UPI001FF415F9|nr:hypothetical protein [Amycolatopsis sp. FBCC-B4732]UOX91459.1 hypothetical protein MUY14_12835 [Amycolatopsis sp. FBCC-B4732]